MTQKEKAEAFKRLHHSDKMLVLPNVWEPLGAMIVEDSGYPAVATSSSAMAVTNGFHDGQKIPFNVLLAELERIAKSVSVPVTADIENGYAADNAELEDNIEALIDAGIIGINYEDSDKHTKQLIPIDTQVERIRLIKQVAQKKNVPLFINERVDVYVHGGELTLKEKLKEGLKRAKAYKEAGADCLFPILITEEDHINAFVKESGLPINVMTFRGIPHPKKLQAMGVARLSLGHSVLNVAMGKVVDFITKMKDLDGYEELSETGLAPDYFDSLVDKTKA